MTSIVKAASPAHFLSLIPTMLGYHPSRSLIIVPFGSSRSLGVMRFDLPSAPEPDAFAATVTGLVCRLPDADGLAMAVWTDGAFGDDGIPHRELADALRRTVTASGLRLVDALCVGADAWGSYLDDGCPRAGWSLDELVFDVPEASGDHRSGAELPLVGDDDRADADDALRALIHAVQVVCAVDDDGAPFVDRLDPRALAAACALDDLPTLFEDALHWDVDDLAAFDVAVLAWCLSRPSVRDIGLVQWCRGLDAGDEALDAQLRWEAGEEYPAHLVREMWGAGEQPDPDRLHTALELCRHVAAAAPESAQPGVLATCAWLSWALGGSTHADLYASRARALEPTHGLAEIVATFVAAGHLPDWAFQRGARGERTAS
ncbi:hypothetical protein GCM10022200_18490 [Microbacterium awajiense]|uniref:DUF4192 family protein n=1 Tax=Microbacterium awajiense TaxID=415214 RepID=A0ABP7ALH0_9MICO